MLRNGKQTSYDKRAKRKEIRTLHEAINHNDVKRVEELLVPNIDVNFHYGGQSALQKATMQGSLEICGLLIQHGADVNKYNAEDNTLLNMATWRGQTDIVRLLVNNGADLNMSNSHISSPLNTAAYKGYAAIAEILSQQEDCDVNSCNKHGQTPLSTAAREGHTEVVNVLLNANVDKERSDNERKTPLILAVEKGREEVAKILIDAGSNVNAQDRYGCTPLWYAANQGLYRTVEHLIQAKANLNLTDHRGNSPFMEAVKSLHLDVVKLLGDSGCDVNLADNTLLQAAINQAVRMASQYFGESAQHQALVKLLLDLGCNVNHADKSGWTPLYHAAFGGELDIVKQLLARNPDLSVANDGGETLLHGAVYGNKPEIMRLLLDAGCKVNVLDRKFRLPLYTGILHRAKIETLEMLLEAGSQTDVCEIEDGRTPLFAAIQQHYSEAVDLLIKYNADVNYPNKDGDTPLWIACEKGNEDVVEALLKHSDIDIDRGVAHIPLHAAVLHGYNSIVHMLLRAGCQVNKLTDLCTSALYFAADANNIHLAKLLVHYGANPSAPYNVKLPRKCCKSYSDPHPHLELEPLQCGLRNDSFMMVKIIIEASPRMPYKVLATLRDLVFRTNYARDAHLGQRLIYQYAQFFTMILHHPRKLQEACRGCIREAIGERPFLKVDKLPVPEKLKDYILMKDFLAEFYK